MILLNILLKQKRVYPYDFMDSFTSFNEKQFVIIPTKNDFTTC